MVSARPRASPKMSSRPRPVRRLRVRPRMARACSSVRFSLSPSTNMERGSAISSIRAIMSPTGQALACSRSRASAGSAELRMMWMTSSILATATARPTSTWPRSRALASSNLMRRTTTSSRNSRKASSSWRRPIWIGRPWFRASMLTPNELCIAVKRHSWFRTTSPEASRFSSMTIRMPSRSDSSRTSEMPSIRFSRTISTIRSIRVCLLTWNGSSVTTMASRSLRMVSIVALPRTMTEPRPSRRALRGAVRPMISPPVGKSGPGTMSSRASSATFGSSSRATQASTISPRLWGGMLVAMPTAMPPAPLTSRFGIRAGRTTGSSSFSS